MAVEFDIKRRGDLHWLKVPSEWRASLAKLNWAYRRAQELNGISASERWNRVEELETALAEFMEVSR